MNRLFLLLLEEADKRKQCTTFTRPLDLNIVPGLLKDTQPGDALRLFHFSLNIIWRGFLIKSQTPWRKSIGPTLPFTSDLLTSALPQGTDDPVTA